MHVIGCSGFLLERPTCWRDTALQALRQMPTNQSSTAEVQSRTTSHPCDKGLVQSWYIDLVGPIPERDQVHYHALRLFLQVAWSCPTLIEISRRCIATFLWWLSSSKRVQTTAAAYHAAINDNVGALVFDEAKMRAHLIKCFEKGKLSRFPRTKKATSKRPAPQSIAITIYTVCAKDRTLWGYDHVWQM